MESKEREGVQKGNVWIDNILREIDIDIEKNIL